MSVDKPSPLSNSIRDVLERLDSMDIAKSSDDIATETPLQRIVTLATDDNIASGRPSHDSYMNAEDYLSQMGFSPRVNVSDNVRPAPVVVSATNFSTTSMMSPCVRSDPIMSLNLECIETPMPKDNVLNWGSKPIKGRDWGESTRCDFGIIDTLTAKFEERRNNPACATPDCNDSTSKSERTLSSPFRAISLTRASSTVLGFDQEADDECCTVTTDICEDEQDEDMNRISCEGNTLTIAQETDEPTRASKRREMSIAKRTRMSICESSLASPRPFRLSSVNSRQSFAFCEASARPNVDKLQTLRESAISCISHQAFDTDFDERDDRGELFSTHKILVQVFSYLTEFDLLCGASLVSSSWADAVTDAHASLMFLSVGCSSSFAYNEGESLGELGADEDDDEHGLSADKNSAVVQSMERSWDYLVHRFPWGMFLSEGTFKRVYKVWNSNVNAEEAISVMNVDQIDNLNVVGSELAVSVMLSSMARRNICPNFVLVRGVFTSEYEPSPVHWGSAENKRPFGSNYDANQLYTEPRKPPSTEKGSFQYIRMELCKHGDVEEYMKRQPDSVLKPSDSRALLFQMAFSLHVAGNKFGMKHYDVKLLNFFLDDTNDVSTCANKHPYTCLRYGLGSHVFNVRMRTASAVLAKLADFGTANVRADSNGQPVLIGNFTTLENTPPDYMILGDAATQGYGHDCFGLGLCMFHLFTGHAPYEEILETVHCPPNLKKKLKSIWENHKSSGYEVIRNVIRCDVFEDEEGNIIEGEVDETLYDTLYRFLVLFGIPQEKFQWKDGSRVWRAIDSCLGTEDTPVPVRKSRRNAANAPIRKDGPDACQYVEDCKMFSIFKGGDEHIARARKHLKRANGGMDLLLSLVSFDPKKRASPLDVLNSTFMETLREGYGAPELSDNDIVYSYTAYKI
jgi:serine/threonine protein kinase